LISKVDTLIWWIRSSMDHAPMLPVRFNMRGPFLSFLD
jgi:hypothetical protein